MKRMKQWLMDRLAPPAPPADPTFDAAMQITDEVTEIIRERKKEFHPFRSILAELLLRQQHLDPALIADAYEAHQESRIYRGRLNGG